MDEEKSLVQLDHGGGGRMARRLVEELVAEFFSNDVIDSLGDSAVMAPGKGKLAFTTDSFVVTPLFFPGGDIGRLAVCGTVNDLAVTGAVPAALSCALIIEEGFPVAELKRVLASIRATLEEAGVSVVTGDTKVVERGSGGGLYINTAGVGWVPDSVHLSMEGIGPGDVVIVTGSLGDHGAAILAARKELELETELASDCMPLNGVTAAVLETAPGTKFMRDPTRGGLAALLNDVVHGTGHGILLEETAIPVKPEVAAICEILGFDVLYLACEGRAVAIVPEEEAAGVVERLKGIPGCGRAAVLGRITAENPGKVIMRTGIGGRRIVPYIEKDQLPRIC